MYEEKELREWVDKMVDNAKSALNLKGDIIIKLESIGDRFKTLENAAEKCSDDLYVNLDWLKSMKQNPDETEVRLIIYHEIRHFYQVEEVEKLKKNLLTIEDVSIIQKWYEEFANYKRNEGGDTKKDYYKQSIEVDAYAFGICLLNYDVSKGDILSLNTCSIPDDIYDALEIRIHEVMAKNFTTK